MFKICLITLMMVRCKVEEAWRVWATGEHCWLYEIVQPRLRWVLGFAGPLPDANLQRLCRRCQAVPSPADVIQPALKFATHSKRPLKTQPS